MYPILYKSDETDFLHNGLGVLKDAISVKATEELNGLFELEIEYDPEGFLIHEIDYEMIVKAKVNDKQDEQLFRIYGFDKSFQNDNILIHCQHITYDAAGNFVEELELNNVTTDVAMQTLQSKLAYPSKITFSSPSTTTRSSTKLYRTNPLQMVAGMDGSILDNWGGEIERDNFRLVMHARRGKDDGVLIAYKKNLTGLEAKFDMSNVVTRIFPFVIKDDALITIPNKYIDSPNINAYEYIKIEPVDFSGDENITDSTSLYNASKNYFNSGGKDLPTVTMDVEFEPLWDTEEYKDLAVLELVGMGDTVTVRHTKMGIDVTAKVNRIEYDVISQKNSAVGIGSVQAGLTDKVNKSANMENAVKQAVEAANKAVTAANGKNRNYYGPNEPKGTFLEGDLWFRLVDGDYTQTYRYDGIQWQLIVDMDVNVAKQEAEEATERAEDAFNRANEATANAQQAIEEAQASFDKAQEALDTASVVNSIAVDAVNVANTAKQSATNAINKASELESQVIDDFASVNSRADDLLAKINDNAASLKAADGKITSIEQNVDTINGSLSLTITTLSDLDATVSEQQTAITALDEKIELRATKTSVDTLTGRISNAESSISTIVGQIELKANREDVYTKTETDGRVTSAINSAKSEIKITTDGISQSVSSLSATVNGIEIGGRNYAIGTANSKTFTGKGGTNETATLYYVDFSKLAGKTITISFDYIATSTGGKFRLQQATSPYMSITELNIYTKTNLTHYSHTMNLPSTSYEPRYINIRMDDFVGDITISNLKLEIGNKETDWTQAIEDTDNAISDVQSYASSIDQKADSIQSSVSNLNKTVNSQGSRISNAETTINQHTTAINLKAEATNVYTKAQTDSALNNKVNLSTYNNKMSQIDVSINGISNRVSSTESSITGLNGEINTVKSNIASLDIKADGIISSVSQVQTDFDNLQIGGRNIIRNGDFSNNLSSWSNWSGGTRSVVNIIGLKEFSKAFKIVSTAENQGIFQNYDAKPSQSYTISFWARADSGRGYLQLQVVTKDNSVTYPKAGEAEQGDWVKRVYTFITPSNVSYISIRVGRGGGGESGTYYFTGIKLEEGNKATSWTPAPEDQATVIQFSTLEQTVNGITTRVGTAEGNISSLQQTASSFATRISNAEGSISSISQTLKGVQTTVSNKADKSIVTQLASVVDSKISTTDANNKFATQSQLTQTSSSLTSKISSLSSEVDKKVSRKGYQTSSTSGDNSGKWTLFARTRVNGRYQHGEISFDITGGADGSSRGKFATLFLRHKQQNELGVATFVDLSVSNATFLSNSDFLAICTTNTSSEVIVEYYVKIRATYEQYFFQPYNESGNINKIEYLSNQGFKTDAQLPSGARFGAIYSGNLGRIVTAESQITQLSDAINLRVTKNDVINQINIDTSGVLIQGKKLVLDGNVTVNGTFKVGSGNITSLDAGKITTGTLDAAKVSVVNLNASNIKSGTLSAITINGTTIKGGTIEGSTVRSSNTSNYWDANYKNRAEISGGQLKIESKGVLGQGEVTIANGRINIEGQPTSVNVPDEYKNGSNWTWYGNGIISAQNKLFMDVQKFAVGGMFGHDLEVYPDILHPRLYFNSSGFKITHDDRSDYVASDYIYKRTYGDSPNLFITSNGVIGRSTSASKYKINISEIDLSNGYAERIFNLKPKKWYDKASVEAYADSLTRIYPSFDFEGDESDLQYIDSIYGLIAEDLIEAGLEKYVTYAYKDDGSKEVEGIMYDRLWTLLIPISKRHDDTIITIQGEIAGVKSDIISIKGDIEGMKTETTLLKDEVSSLKEKIKQLEKKLAA